MEEPVRSLRNCKQRGKDRWLRPFLRRVAARSIASVRIAQSRLIVPRLGEEKAATIGLSIAACSYAGYGLAPQGWMIYVILVVGSFGGITGPAVQGLISRSVGANEQGGVQGSLTSLASIAGIIGP